MQPSAMVIGTALAAAPVQTTAATNVGPPVCLLDCEQVSSFTSPAVSNGQRCQIMDAWARSGCMVDCAPSITNALTSKVQCPTPAPAPMPVPARSPTPKMPTTDVDRGGTEGTGAANMGEEPFPPCLRDCPGLPELIESSQSSQDDKCLAFAKFLSNSKASTCLDDCVASQRGRLDALVAQGCNAAADVPSQVPTPTPRTAPITTDTSRNGVPDPCDAPTLRPSFCRCNVGISGQCSGVCIREITASDGRWVRLGYPLCMSPATAHQVQPHQVQPAGHPGPLRGGKHGRRRA